MNGYPGSLVETDSLFSLVYVLFIPLCSTADLFIWRRDSALVDLSSFILLLSLGPPAKHRAICNVSVYAAKMPFGDPAGAI